MGDTFTQNNVHGDNHMYVGKQPFILTQDIADKALAEINRLGKEVELVTAGDQEIARQFNVFLRSWGVKIRKWIHAKQLIGPDKPMTVEDYGSHTHVTLDSTK